MKIDLTGCTAIVTGSTAGIGRATAEGLARAGAAVIVNSRTQARVCFRRELPFASGTSDDRFVPNLAVYHRERPRPSDPMRSMNEWQKLGSGEGGLSVCNWVELPRHLTGKRAR